MINDISTDLRAAYRDQLRHRHLLGIEHLTDRRDRAGMRWSALRAVANRLATRIAWDVVSGRVPEQSVVAAFARLDARMDVVGEQMNPRPCEVKS